MSQERPLLQCHTCGNEIKDYDKMREFTISDEIGYLIDLYFCSDTCYDKYITQRKEQGYF